MADRRMARRLLACLIAVGLLATACAADPAPPSAVAQDGDTGEADQTGIDPLDDIGGPETGDPAVSDSDASVAASSTPAPTGATATPATGNDGGGAVERWQPDIDPASPQPAEWSVPFELDARTEQFELDNGLRVIVRRNSFPGGQAQLRLVVDAGSLEEDPDHLGSAHFLEHMMFNGTERYPGNELIPVLESFGAAFGPDVNAYTSFSETVYQLTVPTRSHAVVEQGLEVLAEWASRVTIAPEAVAAERGVVREEWRRRAESASGRIGREIRSVLFTESAYLGREPIGTIESIDSMEATELRAFYETWYRPDLMTVIVVGDVSLSGVVASVEELFGSLPPSAVDAPAPVVDDPPAAFPEPVYDVIVDPEVSQTDLELLWRRPGGPMLTPTDLHRSLVGRLTATVLDLRLFEAAERNQSAARSAAATSTALTPDLDLFGLSAEVDASRVIEVLDELLTRAEQVRQHGVTDEEFVRAVDRVRAGIEQQFAESARTQDSRLAAGYVALALGEGTVPEPEAERDHAIEVLERITVRDLRAFVNDALDTPPYVLVTAPASVQADLPEPEDLAETHDARVGWQVDPPETTSTGPEVLLEPPPPADEVGREFIPELSTTVVTYANGARVALRNTQIVQNRVEFQAWSRGGFFQEEGTVVPLLGRAASLVMPSGFDSVDAVSLDRLLGGRVVSLSADVGRAEETLHGEAATDDLETLLQLVHLQMTEPTISPVAVRRFDEAWRPLAENPDVRPTLAADLQLWQQRYGDSPYFRLFPTLEDLDALDVDDQLEAWRGRFANAGDFVFVFVGDIEGERLFRLTERYIGTLPSSADREVAIDRDPGIPEENLISTVAVGVGEQGRLRINWESPYPFTLEAEVAATALEIVVDARLRDLVREELGASYAPTAAVTLLSEPKPWVDTIIEVDGDPDRLDEVSRVVRDELARIRAGDLDAGYLERAVDQLVEDYRFFSNPDWIDRITFHLANPDRDAGEYRERDRIASALTVADLAETAVLVFPASRSVEVRLVPSGGD